MTTANEPTCEELCHSISITLNELVDAWDNANSAYYVFRTSPTEDEHIPMDLITCIKQLTSEVGNPLLSEALQQMSPEKVASVVRALASNTGVNNSDK